LRMSDLKKAVFLDKDGTLVVDVPYNVDTGRIKLMDDCLTGLKHLQQHDYLLVVVSNQSGVARGYFKEEALIAVRQKLTALLQAEGIKLNGFYYCPHHPEGIIEPFAADCDCRKPKPGLLLKAAGELNIDLQASWMIGDILNDVEAGNRAGCKTILIDNGGETEWLAGEAREPLATVKTINQAAEYILKTDGD
jgi:D-glycero-D-manno-heptose 1,7-bisphosphate phosphatase